MIWKQTLSEWVLTEDAPLFDRVWSDMFGTVNAITTEEAVAFIEAMEGSEDDDF